MTGAFDPFAELAAALPRAAAAAEGNPYRLERPVKVTLSITETCNLDCALCYADCHRPKEKPELTTAQWIALLDEMFESGVVCSYFEGGEPLCRADMLELLTHASERSFTMLRTNGTLVEAETARLLAAANVAIVLVDLWGATAESHDCLTGVPGSFARSLAGIEHLARAGLEVQTLIILNRVNIAEMQDYLQLVQGLGVATVGILRLYPLGLVKRRWRDLALSLEEMQEAVDGLVPPPGLRLMRSWHPLNANCCWQMAAVDAYGRSMGCSYLREYVDYGSLLEKSFLETWQHPLSRRLRLGKVRESCPDCRQSQGSAGGCRSTAYAFTGDFDAPDPFDLRLNRGRDLRELPDWLLSPRPGNPPSAGS